MFCSFKYLFSPICAAHTVFGCEMIQWSMVYLSGTKYLKKADSTPSSYKLLKYLQLCIKLFSYLSSLHGRILSAWTWTGLMHAVIMTVNIYIICGTTLLWLENSFSVVIYPVSYSFLFLFCEDHRKLKGQTFSLHLEKLKKKKQKHTFQRHPLRNWSGKIKCFKIIFCFPHIFI